MKASKKLARNESEEEVVLDAESGEEVLAENTELSAVGLQTKLKALRTELAATKKECQENLTGWQRTKADLANFRRMVEEDKERDGIRARAKLVRELIPGLDAFDAAMADPKWGEVGQSWREGMERVAAQFHKVLEQEGLESYGAVGDAFDPTVHECMSMHSTDAAEKDHTIAQVLQKGYKIGDEVVRAAKVVVYQHN